MIRTTFPYFPPRGASLALGILFAFGAASLGVMPGTAAAQVTLNVPAEYPTIQQAIDAAGTGDTVLVAPGTYLETIDMGRGGFTLRSSHGAEVTIIDAQQADQSPVVRVSGAPAGTALEGFTITGGTGAFWKSDGNLRGGGVSVVQGLLDMIDCRITGNTADWGGGVDVRGAAVTVTGTEFIANEATIGWGGVVVGFSGSSLTLNNCLFENNTAQQGGGLDVNSGPAQVNDCVFNGNHANSSGGGAIVFNSGEFTNCHFENNTATLSGGGVRISGDASFDDCQFIGNQAARGGGGAMAFNDSAEFNNCRFENNIATGEPTSSGGGLLVANQSIAVITACEFVDNIASGQLFSRGGGLNVRQQGDATVSLSIFQNNQATFGGGADIQSNASAMFSECSFVGNTADQNGGGAGVVNSAAGFEQCEFIGNQAELGGGIHVNSTGAAVLDDCTIIENTALVNGGGAFVDDGGALDVTGTTICLNTPNSVVGVVVGHRENTICGNGDLTGNGVVDVEDLLILLAAWGQCDDVHDCPADLNGDGVVNVFDLLILLVNLD